jgi:CHASE2 domain-containing sensor protein
MAVANYLRNRWDKELKYWRLRWWQFVMLLLWSAWSLICGWLFPAHPELWLFPQAPFLAFGYLGGGLFMFIFPGQPWAYPLGLCFTIFLLTYLALVSWRWHRDGKRPNPSLQRDASPQGDSRP